MGEIGKKHGWRPQTVSPDSCLGWRNPNDLGARVQVPGEILKDAGIPALLGPEVDVCRSVGTVGLVGRRIPEHQRCFAEERRPDSLTQPQSRRFVPVAALVAGLSKNDGPVSVLETGHLARGIKIGGAWGGLQVRVGRAQVEIGPVAVTWI